MQVVSLYPNEDNFLALLCQTASTKVSQLPETLFTSVLENSEESESQISQSISEFGVVQLLIKSLSKQSDLLAQLVKQLEVVVIGVDSGYHQNNGKKIKSYKLMAGWSFTYNLSKCY